MTADLEYTLACNDLKFRYTAPNCPPGPWVLHDVTLNLPKGAICILVGANGAGKSTLLQILAGKKLVRGAAAKVLGQEVFFNTPSGVTYLGTEWAQNAVVRSDLSVAHFLESVGGSKYAERRDHLLEIMDVDVNWHMHTVSDGERRRIQIVSGLMQPFQVLLLDEVTVDLDVFVRSRFLDFLAKESSVRGATILYATHIFDGLDSFPTHLCHVRLGTTILPSPISWPLEKGMVSDEVTAKMEDPNRKGSRLLEVALSWLTEDREVRVAEGGVRGNAGRDGAAGSENKEQALPGKGEEFFKQYDYSK